MRITLFNHVNGLLTGIKKSDGKRVIRHVGIWNSQTQLPMEEQPFLLPAVFLEFGSIRYDTLSGGGQRADLPFTLHIVSDARKGTELEAMKQNCELAKLIHSTLARTRTENIGSIIRLGSETDSNFDEWVENQEEYVCSIYDASAGKRWSQQQIDDIEITTATAEGKVVTAPSLDLGS